IINSKKLRRHNRTKPTDQSSQSNHAHPTPTDKSDGELTVRNPTPENIQNNHWDETGKLETNQPFSTMTVTNNSNNNSNHDKSLPQSINCITTPTTTTTHQELSHNKNSHLTTWNPENLRPISDLATYTVKSNSSLSMTRPCSHTESITNTNSEELSSCHV
ncbi:unnamed protein product, partial [Schistosoma turkestanicum]